MERVKVHTFHSNGNDVICKYMNVERVNENILYIAANEVYGNENSKTFYCLIAEYNSTFVNLGIISNLDIIKNYTFDKILEIYNNRIKGKYYFNKVDLIMCKAISDKLYEDALTSRNYVLSQRAEEDRKNQEKRRIEAQEEKTKKEQEKARKKIEREEKKKKDELFFIENIDVLKDNLSSFEKLTAIKELNKLYQWHFSEPERIITCSILDLIRKHSYCKITSVTQEYSKSGDLLITPKTYYYIGTAKDSLGFQIPAKLGKIMTLNENNQ